MIMRGIIDWCDNKMHESIEEDNDRKAALSGFVEGFCDGAIIMYVPVLISCFVYQALLKKK